ncbi:MAG: glycosyltransferase [Eubacteriales bacterium]|nr:glycosyltransferase [Eubacteriales bacterium]
MRKVLQCLMSLEIGGAETHVVELSKYLAKKGYEVIVASNGGTYEKELVDAGVKVIRIPMHSKKPFFIVQSLFLLNKLIRNFRPDIVHAHARIPGLYVSIFEKIYNFRMVTTVHGKFKINWLLKHITQWGKEIFVVSEDLKAYLIENYPVERANIFNTVNGIDTDRFYPSIASEIEYDIIHVSRLDQGTSKTAEMLIDYTRESNVNVLVVGSGSELDNLREKSAEIYNISFQGATNRVDLELRKAKVFVGISRSALEAMSMNMPVVLSGDYGYMGIMQSSVLDEAIQNNFTARVSTNLDYEKLRQDLDVILKMSPELFSWERDFIQNHYSISKMSEDYIRVYENE